MYELMIVFDYFSTGLRNEKKKTKQKHQQIALLN